MRKALPRGGNSTTYRYRDEKFQVIHVSQQPKSDDAAIQYLWAVRDIGDAWWPVYVEREIGTDQWIMLRYRMEYGTCGGLFDEIVSF